MNHVTNRLHIVLVLAAVLTLVFTTSPASSQVYMVKDINPDWAHMGAFDAAPLGTSILFSADDGTLGSELWISNGTTIGTDLLKDIWQPGTTDPTEEYSSSPENFTAIGGLVYFQGYTGVEIEGSVDRRLFVSNGTSEGTVELDIIPLSAGWASMGGSLYFLGWDSASGYEIRKTNGTTVTLVKEIASGTSSIVTGGLSVVDFTLFGERLVFSAEDATNGFELWISDGSDAGTGLLKNIVPGTDDGWPQHITAFGGQAFFSAEDVSGDRELWVSDGSESGTVRLKDINSTGSSNPHTFMPYNDFLFFVADDGDHGAELSDLRHPRRHDRA